MDLLIGAAFVAWCLMKAWGTARTEHELAQKGIVPPRMAAKYGTAEAARKVARYGFTDFLRDAWNDYWPRRTEALVAARNAKAENPGGRVSFKQRLRAGVEAVQRSVQAGIDKAKAAREPKSAPKPRTDPTPTPLATESGDVDPGTRRMGDHGWEEWDGTEWRPAPEPNPAPPPQAAPTPAPTAAPATNDPPAPQEGPKTMTAPTGEAVNYETTVAELEAQIREQQAHLDQCLAAEQAAETLASAVDGMQCTYRGLSDAAANTHDHLAAQNLDGTTLASTGDTADALPPGRVDEMLDYVEQIKAVAAERRAAAEAALAATTAALDHIQRTYGDAHETVAGNLSGDAGFLHSGGPSGVSPAAGARAAAADDRSREVADRFEAQRQEDRGEYVHTPAGPQGQV